MVNHLGLTAAERRTFEQTLRSSHDIEVDVDVLDLDLQLLSSVTAKVLDGQVQVDRHGFGEHHGPQRRITLSLFDPTFGLKFDSPSLRDGTVYYDRLVRVHYNVRVPELQDWINVPVFTGPPWKLQRDEAEVYIEADDASVLGFGELWQTLHIKKGTPKVEAAKRILRRVGFTHFRFPDRKAKLAHPVSIGRRGHAWAWAARILASMDLHLYIDGRGVPAARQLPEHPAWTFNPGQNGEIIDPVARSTDREGFYNVVKVVGRRPKGAKHRVSYTAYPHRSHPHSPWSLARDNGDKPYFKVKTIHNDHFRTDHECERKARRVLRDVIRAKEELTASIVPWPHAEQGDMVRFRTLGGGVTTDRLDTFTLPLTVTGGQPMTIGWFDQPALHKRRIRR